MFHETEKIYKIWRGIDLSFQNWHKEFHKFWPEYSEVSKILTLTGSFWAKYILFELKKYRGLSFMKLKRDTKFREESTCFKIDIRNLKHFDLSTRKSQKMFTLIGFFWAKYILFGTDELSFMKLKRDTQFGEESTCHFKIDIRNFTNFDLSTRKSQKFSL